MPVMKFMQASSEGKAKAVSSEEIIPADAKKIGSYMCVDTEYTGIKKVVSKQGGYIVVLDYGRQYKMDKKTGALVLKQCKSTKHVDTEAEARRLRREAEAFRQGKSYSDGRPLDILFVEAIEDYKQSERYIELSDSYKDHAKNYLRHARDYFINSKVKSISITDMEAYFKFLQEKGNRTPTPENQGRLKINTINKHKTMMKKLWDYFIDSKKYGITENVADRAKLPKVEITVDGKKKKVSKEEYHSYPLSIEELNYTLNDIVQNEFDRSILVMAALSAIGSLRRSEVAGLRAGKFYHNEFMNISDEAYEYSGYDKEYYESHDELMFIDTAIIALSGKDIEKLPKGDKIRVSAKPECLKRIVEYAMEQRKEVFKILGREICSTDPIYCPLINVINNQRVSTQKISKKWEEYQNRRNKRMIKLGLKPIPVVRLHDLRHTHSQLSKSNKRIPSWDISKNMGHMLPASESNTTTRVYLSDRKPDREDIISYFDSIISIDWDKAMNLHINEYGSRVTVNNSGHLVVSQEEKERRKKNGSYKSVFKEEEYEEMFKPLDEDGQ